MEQGKQSREVKSSLSDGVGSVNHSGGKSKIPVTADESHKSSNMVDSILLESYQKREVCSGPFPVKLLTIIKIFEEEGKDYIRWRDPRGCVFEINSKLEGFDENVMKRFFRGSKIASLYRQLNIYDFQRISKGTHANCYFHQNFRKDNVTLAFKIKRNAVKGDYGNAPSIITFEHGAMADPLQGNSIQPRNFSTISSADTSTASAPGDLTPQNPLLQQLRLEAMLQLNAGGLFPVGSSSDLLRTSCFLDPNAYRSPLHNAYSNGMSDMERMIQSAVEARNIKAALLRQEPVVLTSPYGANSSLDSQRLALMSLLDPMNASNNRYNGILGANGEEELMISLGLRR